MPRPKLGGGGQWAGGPWSAAGLGTIAGSRGKAGRASTWEYLKADAPLTEAGR